MNAQVKQDDKSTKTEALVIPKDVEALTTKSAKIRKLHELGWKRGSIAKVLGIRYQHVRNVLTQPLKRKDA